MSVTLTLRILDNNTAVSGYRIIEIQQSEQTLLRSSSHRYGWGFFGPYLGLYFCRGLQRGFFFFYLPPLWYLPHPHPDLTIPKNLVISTSPSLKGQTGVKLILNLKSWKKRSLPKRMHTLLLSSSLLLLSSALYAARMKLRAPFALDQAEPPFTTNDRVYADLPFTQVVVRPVEVFEDITSHHIIIIAASSFRSDPSRCWSLSIRRGVAIILSQPRATFLTILPSTGYSLHWALANAVLEGRRLGQPDSATDLLLYFIQVMGRWSSDCYDRYTRNSQSIPTQSGHPIADYPGVTCIGLIKVYCRVLYRYIHRVCSLINVLLVLLACRGSVRHALNHVLLTYNLTMSVIISKMHIK